MTPQGSIFAPGDAIVYADDLFIVKKNYGSSGTVQEMGATGSLSNFSWHCYGETSRFATAEELQPFVDAKLPLALVALERLQRRALLTQAPQS